MPPKTEIEHLVIETVHRLAEDFELAALQVPTSETALYGREGPLDSMGLVNLISDLEDAVAEKYNTHISLADEKAMSAERSPYRSVESMTDAILERMPG